MPVNRRDLLTTFTAGLLAPNLAAAEEPAATPQTAEPERALFSGRVIRLADALRQREIRFTEEMESHVVLESAAGDLTPILADWRGRAFYQDERLRDRQMHLVGLKRPGLPYLQVLMVFAVDEDGRHEYVDYWCDVCSIPMYEIKPCECCQGETRLRFTPRELPEEFRTPPAP
jgi:hypothetical protein